MQKRYNKKELTRVFALNNKFKFFSRKLQTIMTAKEAISPSLGFNPDEKCPVVAGDMPLLELLPKLLDAPQRRVVVKQDGELIGSVDSQSMLETLGRQIPMRDDCSVLVVECAPADYSASHIARAVEDADVHLVDLLSTPAAEGKLHVTMRVRCEDPEAVVHSLERYGYDVLSVWASEGVSPTASLERILSLQTLMNV